MEYSQIKVSCPTCRGRMTHRVGRFGDFFFCSSVRDGLRCVQQTLGTSSVPVRSAVRRYEESPEESPIQGGSSIQGIQGGFRFDARTWMPMPEREEQTVDLGTVIDRETHMVTFPEGIPDMEFRIDTDLRELEDRVAALAITRNEGPTIRVDSTSHAFIEPNLTFSSIERASWYLRAAGGFGIAPEIEAPDD